MYTAIIVEPRRHKALSFVLNNILTNLSDDWNVVVCHGTQNEKYVNDIINNDLSSYKHRITLQNLGVDNLNSAGYNYLMATKQFHDYIPTEMFLVFQTDSIIIPKYSHLINSFLQYDYVGAPWAHVNSNLTRQVGNGGFSLRRKSKMLEIIEKVPYPGINEDVYFSLAPVDMKKPSWDEAKLFSVEEVYSPVSFGCHAPFKYPSAYNFCNENPDVQMLSRLQS